MTNRDLLLQHLRESHGVAPDPHMSKSQASRLHGLRHSKGKADHTHPETGSPSKRLIGGAYG